MLGVAERAPMGTDSRFLEPSRRLGHRSASAGQACGCRPKAKPWAHSAALGTMLALDGEMRGSSTRGSPHHQPPVIHLDAVLSRGAAPLDGLR